MSLLVAGVLGTAAELTCLAIDNQAGRPEPLKDVGNIQKVRLAGR